uniref:Metal response element-binding transcription factor isoform 5 n=1 Tax=Oncorhynchus mykiss TaxID=8022 RepID=Q3ZT94_ONCMY|nr:metal response element-binding transcription factor isoform 5 [Oncorhynchus mykiss]
MRMNVHSNETMLFEEEVDKTSREVEADNVSTKMVTVNWDQWDRLLLPSPLDSGVHSLDTVYDRTTVMIEQDPVGSTTDNKEEEEDLMMYLDEGFETEDRGGLEDHWEAMSQGYIHHTISQDQIQFTINPGSTPMPRHIQGATITLHSECPDTHHSESDALDLMFELLFQDKPQTQGVSSLAVPSCSLENPSPTVVLPEASPCFISTCPAPSDSLPGEPCPVPQPVAVLTPGESCPVPVAVSPMISEITKHDVNPEQLSNQSLLQQPATSVYYQPSSNQSLLPQPTNESLLPQQSLRLEPTITLHSQPGSTQRLLLEPTTTLHSQPCSTQSLLLQPAETPSIYSQPGPYPPPPSSFIQAPLTPLSLGHFAPHTVPAQSTLQPLTLSTQNLQWLFNSVNDQRQRDTQTRLLQQHSGSTQEKLYFTTAIPMGGNTGTALQQLGLRLPVIVIRQGESCQCRCPCRDGSTASDTEKQTGCQPTGEPSGAQVKQPQDLSTQDPPPQPHQPQDPPTQPPPPQQPQPPPPPVPL